MIGPQSSAVQTQLGSADQRHRQLRVLAAGSGDELPRGPGSDRRLPAASEGTPADELGYYVAPFAYAQLQVVEQAIQATGGLDDAGLADYTREATFSTVVGDVTFGRLGEWAVPRVLTVQFRGIGSSDISEFAKPEARVVVAR